MVFKRITLATALALGAGLAQAQTVVPWGTHDPAELGGTLFFGTGGTFAFEVIYTFSVTGPTSLLVTGVSNDSPGVFDISGATVKLFSSNGNANFNDDVLLGSFGFDSTSVSNLFNGVAPGSYFYKVAGTVTGPMGGSYLVSSALAPIPEPSAAHMLAAGLLAGGLLMRRRAGR